MGRKITPDFLGRNSENNARYSWAEDKLLTLDEFGPEQIARLRMLLYCVQGGPGDNARFSGPEDNARRVL